jgi:sialate O-acetylesterase
VPIAVFSPTKAFAIDLCANLGLIARMNHVRLLGILSIASFAANLHADVRLHALFTDNMVLQRGATVPVWGWADDGEEVTVDYGGQKASSVASGGKWMVRLKNLKTGEAGPLSVTGKNKISLKNVVVGEVWLASGQSNMEWPLKAAHAAQFEIATASNPMLRLYTVKKLRETSPTNNCIGNWDVCSPASASNFSAVAYFFARHLQKALNVPVGVIHSSWGGSPAEVWMSDKVLSSNPEYKRDILDPYPALAQKNKDDIAAWEKEEAEAKKEGKPFTKWKPWQTWRPTELYNGMIAPLLPFAIKGAIWYQGESNADRAEQYRRLFPDMITNWRKDWGQGDFPFLEVQLAPFKDIQKQPAESSWAELREAQVYTTKVLPNVGIAVITDVGEEKDIHPQKKEPVGVRLALAAQAIAYHQRIEFSGPQYKSMRVKGDEVILTFDHAGSGLEARDGALKGFSIAGEDRKFVWADAKVDGNKVVVHSSTVTRPVAVRYGWADFPVVNLWNKDGLPAVPFRTDDFPMITAGKK